MAESAGRSRSKGWGVGSKHFGYQLSLIEQDISKLGARIRNPRGSKAQNERRHSALRLCCPVTSGPASGARSSVHEYRPVHPDGLHILKYVHSISNISTKLLHRPDEIARLTM